MSVLRKVRRRKRTRNVPIASAKPAKTPPTTATQANLAREANELSYCMTLGREEGCAPSGASQRQNPKTIRAPVAAPARNPAMDLRFANGKGSRREVRGSERDWGRRLVWEPYIRPKKDAEVSHHDKLWSVQ